MANEKKLQEIFDTGSFLGQGWSFPPVFTKAGNVVQMVKAEEDIKQALYIILSTTLGERAMRSDFGADLKNQIFEPMDAGFKPFVTAILKKAITLYEPRVNLDSIEATVDPLQGRIELTINFTVLSNNTRYNIVYPYYINEGTNVQQ